MNSWNQLRDLITSTIAPTSWEEVGGNGQMKFNDSTFSLIVRQSQAVHDELRSLLKQLRTMQDQQVSLEFWLIKTDENFHGFGFDLPAGWTTLKADEHQLLNPKQTAAMIKAANGTNRVSIFGLPKVTLLSGQQLGCEFVNESLPTALHIAGAAVQSPNRDFVRLHLSANNSLQTMKRAGVTTRGGCST